MKEQYSSEYTISNINCELLNYTDYFDINNAQSSSDDIYVKTKSDTSIYSGLSTPCHLLIKVNVTVESSYTHEYQTYTMVLPAIISGPSQNP